MGCGAAASAEGRVKVKKNYLIKWAKVTVNVKEPLLVLPVNLPLSNNLTFKLVKVPFCAYLTVILGIILCLKALPANLILIPDNKEG